MRELVVKIKSEYGKTITLILSAMMVLFALTSKWDIVPETGLNHPLADFVNRFSYSFNFGDYSDVFVICGVILLIKTIRNNEKGVHRCTLILSAILAVVYICSLSFMKYASMIVITHDAFQFFYAVLLFIGTTLLIYYSIRLCSILISRENSPEAQSKVERKNFFEKNLFWFSFLIIATFWFFWLVCTYPGTSNPDAIYQLLQYYSGDITKWTTHHPPFSTLIMGSLVTVGKLIFKSADVGFFMYLVLQTVAGALIFAYGVLTLKKYFGIKTKYLVAIDLFFAVVPFWGVYASMVEKSLLYSEFAVLVTILVLPVVKDKEISTKRMLALCVTCILASLLRNNGIYAIVPLLIVLIIYLNGVNRRRIVVTLLMLLVVYYSVNNIIYTNLGIEKGSIAEALSLPFQQTAKYVKYYNEEITEDEREAIDSVLDYETLGERYNPIISNPVKETYKGDNSKLGSYLSVWFKMFFKHPGIYFSAFMDSSYGYIAPVNQSIETTTDFDYAGSGLQAFGLTHQAHYGGVELTNAIRTNSLYVPIVKYLCMPGLYTWLMAICIIVLIRRKCYTSIIVFIPSIMNVLVCLASPLSSSMRYACPTVAAVPFLMGITVYYLQKEDY